MKPLIFFLVAMLLPASATEHGLASHYSVRSNGGTHTASGEKLDDSSMTAAHRTLPFGTMVRVTRVKTGQSVIVRINNRGPFIKGRIIDVSQAAAKALGFKKDGITRVTVTVCKTNTK